MLHGILIFLEAATADYADFYLLPTKHTKRREIGDRIFRFVSFACFVGILIVSVPSMLSAVSPWSLPIIENHLRRRFAVLNQRAHFLKT